MSCNTRSGSTYVSIVTSTGGSTTKIIDLKHYLCNNRRMCIDSSYTPTYTSLTFTTKGITDVGNGSYFLTIGISGTFNYLPVQSYGCCCATECSCPISEPFFVNVDVDYENASAPTYTAGDVVITPIQSCCGQGTTGLVDIKTSVTITAPTTESSTTTT